MNVENVIREIASSSEHSLRRIAELLGKSSSWLTFTLSKMKENPERSIQVNNLNDIARLCGYRVALVKDEEITESMLIID